MTPPVTILIANYCGREALQLCIESILARTSYPEYGIMVYNSPADGQDLPYLRKMAEAGKIRLIAGEDDLGHGPAVWRLLNACKTEWACIIDSDSEILHCDWLRLLFWQVGHEHDLGVAKFREGGMLYPGEFLTPYYWLACALFNVKLYMRFNPAESDWLEQHIKIDEYQGQFHYIPDYKKAPLWKVGIDTGGRLTERLMYENPEGYEIRSMPPNFWDVVVRHYGGISRNHWRPEHPEIAPRWIEIKRRLIELRANK